MEEEPTFKSGQPENESFASEPELYSYLDFFPGIAYRLHLDFTPIFFKGAVEQITGYTETELINASPEWDRIVMSEDLKRFKPLREHTLSSEAWLSFNGDYRIKCKDGSIRWMHEMVRNICDPSGKPCFIQGTIFDITDRIQKQEELKENEAHFRSLFESSPVGIGIANKSGKLIIYNDAMLKPGGYERSDIEKIESMRQLYYNIEDREMVLAAFKKYGYVDAMEIKFKRKDGTPYDSLLTLRPVQVKNEICLHAIVQDITEKKQLQQQYMQAQKMEAIGTLAGGVAHDFNNMLSVIIGYAELSLTSLQSGDPLYDKIAEILKAAIRSKNITRQLLAFARQQAIVTKVLDLNEIVEQSLKMLRRLIRENIELFWHPYPNLEPVKLDPIQIDQILANLCVNARDSIAEFGKITIETGMRNLDDNYCQKHAGFKPGSYVTLTVSDNGCGIDANAIKKIFDPFFSTKGPGIGTGLGLATVYGIVKQNHGFINVYSEPGYGTTFKLYLPRHEMPSQDKQEKSETDIPKGSGQMVLVVEDEAAILELLNQILPGLGYRALLAQTPVEGLSLASKHSTEIDLLITDVIMPGMNGRELAKQIESIIPNIKCLFMSGYTASVIEKHGILDEGINFIQKPFSRKRIANQIRMALERN